MTDDIVTRLRRRAKWCNHGYPNGLGDSHPTPTSCTFCDGWTEAADEIERLRADCAEAYDACRYALADSPRWRENAATVVATWEARRG